VTRACEGRSARSVLTLIHHAEGSLSYISQFSTLVPKLARAEVLSKVFSQELLQRDGAFCKVVSMGGYVGKCVTPPLVSFRLTIRSADHCGRSRYDSW
jgi:hypothetical protein